MRFYILAIISFFISFWVTYFIGMAHQELPNIFPQTISLIFILIVAVFIIFLDNSHPNISKKEKSRLDIESRSLDSARHSEYSDYYRYEKIYDDLVGPILEGEDPLDNDIPSKKESKFKKPFKKNSKFKKLSFGSSVSISSSVSSWFFGALAGLILSTFLTKPVEAFLCKNVSQIYC